MQHYTYLLLNFFSILVPLLFSFEKRICFIKKLPALIPAIVLTGTFFIIWDHYLTVWNVWGFNKEYVLGYFLWDLPIEEWLFFITIPYSCVFIYESLNFLFKKDLLFSISKNISWLLIVVLSIVVLFNTDKLYTSIKFSSTVIFLLLVVGNKSVVLGKFYRAYLVSLIPFFIVNGILTALPVVTYNNAENLGIRIGTIPIEDTVYSLLLLLMNVTFYEFFKKINLHNAKPSSDY